MRTGVDLFGLLCCGLLIRWGTLGAQVYDYEPVRHSNFENNPAYLCSDKPGRPYLFSFIHQGGVYRNDRFSADALRISFHRPGSFSGLGIAAGHTYLNDSVHYSYAGVGAAYRFILLNRIYTRVGLLYKTIRMDAPAGGFDLYSFQPQPEAAAPSLQHNVNASVFFSSPQERSYVAFSVMNASLPGHAGKQPFPFYCMMSIGDLSRFFGREQPEISYTLLLKKTTMQPSFTQDHYLTVVYNGYALTRESSLRLGIRAGWMQSSYCRLLPVLAFYQQHRSKAFRRKKQFSVFQLIVDLGFNQHFKSTYSPNLQFNISRLF